MIWQLLVIFIASFLVRIFSVMVGGGGVILLPLLIFLGLTPSEAIATNRFGALSINFSLLKFYQRKKVDSRIGYFLILPTLIGALLGSLVVIKIDQDLFEKLIGVILLISVPLVFYKNDLGLKNIKISKRRKALAWFLALAAGFLGGTFALTGTWFTYVYLFLGLTFIETAGTRKIPGIVVGASTTVVLILAGLVNWPLALAMFVGSGLGAWLGVDLGIKVGEKWVRRLFIILVIISAVKLLFL